jgi:hypothetical protein
MAEVGPRDTEEALDALRGAMRTPAPDGPDTEDLGRLVAAYCDCARLENLTPEQMLIRLKRTMGEAPVLRARSATALEEARAHVVTLAINAYYDTRADSDRGSCDGAVHRLP